MGGRAERNPMVELDVRGGGSGVLHVKMILGRISISTEGVARRVGGLVKKRYESGELIRFIWIEEINDDSPDKIFLT